MPRDVGNARGLLQEKGFFHADLQELTPQQILLSLILIPLFFFSLTEVKAGNNVSSGVLSSLQKIKSVLGNTSLSFALEIRFQLKAMFSINKGKILPQLNSGHLTEPAKAPVMC